MHTLRDLIERKQIHSPALIESDEWPRAVTPKKKMYVPGESPLVLPGDIEGLKPAYRDSNDFLGLKGADARGSRALLLGSPGMVFPMQRPDDEELVALGAQPQKFRRENPRAFGLAVCVKMPNGSTIFGVSRLVALEHGLRFGSTQLLSHSDKWYEDLEEAESEIVRLFKLAAVGFQPEAEPNGKSWKKVVALLGGAKDENNPRVRWKREMKLAAGLREIDLDIRSNPESSIPQVVKELKSRPPNALLVWVDWVANPEVFTAPFLAARPGAKADVLGTRSGEMSFDEHLAELSMHLSEIAPIEEEPDPQPPGPTSWADATILIKNLISPHFILTDRALKMLPGNPYPDPARMFHFVSRLERVADSYFTLKGQLGVSVADFSMTHFGIEVALFDGELSPNDVEVAGQRLVGVKAIPHVKVDDAKDPAHCGRIYFAMDGRNFRFIVDHIGLHDYG
ncbi:hypothetical protein [Actinacidiphila bryophytorum]|uniref:hypothetical protein n=1 Tax=Actinacidiphila bryophytorum TaxID=1436133 RepID=UPI002176D84F|nr:hypothetical protein [Actinacidiphila bryophytorum]UWE13066.1 hypothetical protein NYE86_33225 [Actinacidiphila bryophytorum]